MHTEPVPRYGRDYGAVTDRPPSVRKEMSESSICAAVYEGSGNVNRTKIELGNANYIAGEIRHR